MSAMKRILLGCFLVVAFACAVPQESDALSLCGLLCSCTVSTSTMAFGSYDAINSVAVPITGSVGVNCQLLSGLVSLSVPFTVTLNKGLYGSFTARQMIGPSSSLLNYNLFINSNMSTVWGDGTGISQTVSSTITVLSVGAIVTQNQTIYAQIPAGQNVRAGSYSDTITATVQY